MKPGCRTTPHLWNTVAFFKRGEHIKIERLARFLAHSGIASRRHAEELIAALCVQAYDQFSSDWMTVSRSSIGPL